MTRNIGLLTVVLVILDIAILVTLSTYHFDTNDNMYAAAPFAPGALYRDVHFVQGPVTFYFLKALSTIIPEGFVYPGFRAASIVLLIATLLVGTFLCIDRWPSRCLFLVFAGTNAFFIYPGLEIGSYSLPLLLLALATASLWKIQDRRIAIGVAALLIGIAASAKLNHVLFFLPLAVFALHRRHNGESLAGWTRAALLPLVLGGLAGSLPVIIAFLRDPGAFVLNTLIFHSKFSLNVVNLGSFARLKLAVNILNDWAVAGGAGFVALGVYAIFVDRSRDERSRHFLLFVMVGVVAALVAALSPGITYIQYWAPATFFAALAGARFFDPTRMKHGLIFVLAVLPVFTVDARALRTQLSTSLEATAGTPEIATVMAVNRKLKAYALRVDDASRCDRRIFSLAGAFVVDSGFTLSRYMEGGIFWSWVSAQVPQAFIDDKKYHLDEYMIHPEKWVRDQRIDFLLLGFYPGLAEADMEKYASERGFSVEVLPAWHNVTLKFYFNPECIRS